MLSKELLEIICCPVCKGDLRYEQDNDLLICTACTKQYPIQDDIPILLPDPPTAGQ